jgi:hypothetical protein
MATRRNSPMVFQTKSPRPEATDKTMNVMITQQHQKMTAYDSPFSFGSAQIAVGRHGTLIGLPVHGVSRHRQHLAPEAYLLNSLIVP